MGNSVKQFSLKFSAFIFILTSCVVTLVIYGNISMLKKQNFRPLLSSEISFRSTEKKLSLSDSKEYKAVRYKSQLREEKSQDIVLTSFFVSKKDPQRLIMIPPTFDYMRNFYTTVSFLKMHTVIMHDGLPDDLIKRYETDLIKFVRTTIPREMSTNNYRFFQYSSYLKTNKYKYVLMIDISDVFFWENPFDYMRTHPGYLLFLSSDGGTISSNFWMRGIMKWCYEEDVSNQTYLTRNAGVWGGQQEAVQCVLKCIVNQLNTTLRNRGNCDMAAYNWCINHGKCVDQHLIDTGENGLVNPWVRDCDSNKYKVIHDKCTNSINKCLYVENGGLVRKKCKTVSITQYISFSVEVPHAKGRFKYRNEFVTFLQQNCSYGAAVEIGVHDGEFTQHNMKYCNGIYYLIDIAGSSKLQQRLREWKDKNIKYLKMTSAQAAAHVPDLSVDWIYIDAVHDYNHVLQDMTVWYPKLKPGGLFSGHGYCVNRSERLTHSTYPLCRLNTTDDGKYRTSFFGEITAVHDFAKLVSVPVVYFTIEENEVKGDTNINPSWYLFKST